MIENLAPVPDVVIEEIDGDLCLLRPDSGDVLILNTTASDVWLLITDGIQQNEVSGMLAASYAVPVDTISSDVARVVADLIERGFLVERS